MDQEASKKPPAKRGRPPRASIPQKIIEGQNSDSNIKCPICCRSFPRTKSLQAHMRTHTGHRPYLCDYPGCEEAFVQSGHLRSHMYKHTGEKPYRCPVEGCRVRYAHSNRQCDYHKSEKLIRDGKVIFRTDLENFTEEQIRWIQMYKEKKFAKPIKVPNPKTASIKVPNLKRKLSTDSLNFDEESFDKGPLPLKSSSPVPMINYETSGYISYTSSETSSSPEHYNLTEELNMDCCSFAPPPKRKYISVEEAASILLDLRNGLCQRK